MKSLINSKKLYKYIAVLSVIICILGYILYSKYIGNGLFGKSNNNTAEVTNTGEEATAFAKAMEPIYANPERILIPSVNVDAEITPVGVSEDGSLETPEKWEMAGWYKKGFKPGEKGNMIINAHYDNNYGGPAAFWMLKNTKAGDTVIVVDEYGRRYEYLVKDYQLIEIDNPDRLDVLKRGDKIELTLITCGGVWIPGQATYDKRLVIKGELIQ